MKVPGEVWEPDSVTPHVRIYEGSGLNWTRTEYCDTTQSETSGKQRTQTLSQIQETPFCSPEVAEPGGLRMENELPRLVDGKRLHKKLYFQY